MVQRGTACADVLVLGPLHAAFRIVVYTSSCIQPHEPNLSFVYLHGI